MVSNGGGGGGGGGGGACCLASITSLLGRSLSNLRGDDIVFTADPLIYFSKMERRDDNIALF
jgi:hypothetical protein